MINFHKSTIVKHKKIFKMLSWGYSAYDIGEKLNVSFRTVEKDIQLMKEHYKAKNQTHLACIGLRREIIK